MVFKPFSTSACEALRWRIRGCVPNQRILFFFFFLQVHEPSPGAWAAASGEEQALVSRYSCLCCKPAKEPASHGAKSPSPPLLRAGEPAVPLQAGTRGPFPARPRGEGAFVPPPGAESPDCSLSFNTQEGFGNPTSY